MLVKTYALTVKCVPRLETNVEDGVLFHTKSNDSPGGYVITLKMQRAEEFNVNLATDIIQPHITAHVPYVQFHLSSDGIDALIEIGDSWIPTVFLQSLSMHKISLNGKNISRRKWALVGNDVIDQ